MADSIFLLDFKRGVVEEIDERDDAAKPGQQSDKKYGRAGVGYTLASLGSPPKAEE